MKIRRSPTMEILNKNKHLKQEEEHDRLNDYSCGLSHVAFGTRKREDNDIGFLLKCKYELSSEVVKQKSENLRLQKICEAERQKTRELEQKFENLSQKNKELEAQLAAANNESQYAHSLALDNAQNLLRGFVDKYHSFPGLGNSSKGIPHAVESNNVVSEDELKIVSQKLLKKMQQEMKELQELNSQFSIHVDSEVSPNLEEPNVEQVERRIENLALKTNSLKHILLQQRGKLNQLINMFSQGECSNNENMKFGIKQLAIPDSSTSPLKANIFVNKFSRPSDESFREYFTKQLGGGSSSEELKTVMQLYLGSPRKENCFGAKNPNDKLNSQKDPSKTISECDSDNRVCPICESIFPKSISQKDFEAHVVNHLEVESASLLEQYVAI